MSSTQAQPEDDDVQAVIAAVWEQQRASVIEKIAVIEDAITDLLSDRLDTTACEQAAREAHMVRGSAGTFGFPDASAIAAELESEFKSAALTAADGPRLAELVLKLQSMIAGEQTEPQKPVVEDPQQPTHTDLMIVTADSGRALKMRGEASRHGLSTVVVEGFDAAHKQLQTMTADLLLLDNDQSGASELTLKFVTDITSTTPSIPVVVLTSPEEITDRVEIARAGARVLLPSDLPVGQIIDAVSGLRTRVLDDQVTVLAVDDDPSILAVLEGLIPTNGWRFVGCDSPEKFWPLLEEVAPDLLILDIEMPNVNGIELCRAVRNDLRWAEIPIIFLTSRSDQQTVSDVFAAGADDFVPKPIVGPELLGRIGNRLERVSLFRALAETDSLTGLANRTASIRKLEQFRKLAHRTGQPVVIGMLDVDKFKEVNDSYGHDQGDVVLRALAAKLTSSFRGEDVISRWGGDEFFVGMYGMSAQDGLARIEEALNEFAEETFEYEGSSFSVTVSAGIAEYPTDGIDIKALYAVADKQLYAAKRSERKRVLAQRSSATEVERKTPTTVYVVEDDESLASLVMHALQTQGLRTRWLSDGMQAVSVLVEGSGRRASDQNDRRGKDDDPDTPKLVILDWDLPGLNGLAVLSSLAQAGKLENTRVIMLTAHSTEAEMVKAFEIGAFDYVAKPFSLPVLIKRVRRALEI